MAWEYLRRISYCSLIFIVHITIVDGSSPKLVSVTRKRNSGDVFEVHALNNSVCDHRICEEYGGLLFNGDTARRKNRPVKCSCYCSKAKKPTFYNTKMGQQSCVKDLEVMKDSNGDICDFYITDAQQLEVLDLYTSGKTRMKSDGSCEQFQISRWEFYVNTSWVSVSSSNTFSVTSGGNGNGSEPKKGHQTFLTWDGNLEPYKGLLIKVMIRCTNGMKMDRCVMLKAKGTHIYHEVPPTLSPINGVASTSIKKAVQARTAAQQESPDSTPPPTGSSSKSSSRKLWIIVSLSIAGVVLVAVIILCGFILIKCRENCRKRVRTVSRHHLTVESQSQSGSEVCPALHDYEYVHYPCLVDGGRTPTAVPIGNIKYERSHDNKLIIWSPGHGRDATPNNQAANTTAPRLPYQRLLTRASSSSPDCRTAVIPASSSAMEDVFPYQKLVKSVPSLRCSDKEESVADASTEKECDVAEQKLYQSLSLQRNPLSCPKECDAGYMRMEGVSRPESTSEYDYANPVELNKLFRLSRSKSQQATIEISIGDLGDTTSNHDQQQQENCAEVQTPECASDAGDNNYENVDDIDLGENFCTAIRIHQGLNADGLSSTTSHGDLSAKCSVRSSGELVDPEEYVEMGKRKSLLMVENSDSCDCNGLKKIEEEEPEYFVLEAQEISEDAADDP